MGSSLSPELREEVTSLVRSVVDRALDGQPRNGRVNRPLPQPADSEAYTAALTNVCTSVSDAVQSTLRTYLRAHNNNKPLNKLPPEVLCAVFEYLAFPGRWAASCVCQHWRRIAIGHARLWSEHVVRHVSDGALQFSRSILARTGRVPLDVDITFRQLGVRAIPPSATLALTGFAETLLEHLHHTRSLTAHIELLPALSYVPSVLLNPAPLLTTLELAVSDSLIGASLCLPGELFARDAPLLERAVLHRVQIPRGWTPPFSALQSLAITFFGDVDSDSVLRLVEAAPRLRRLALALGNGDGGFPTWTSDVACRTGIETLYVQAGVPFREEELLRTVRFFLEGNAVTEVGLCAPAERELDWLLARCEGCETLALVTRTGYAFALTCESRTTTRAWQLRLRDLPAILDRHSLFTRLRALTLAEAAWCEPLCAARPRMPPAPRLERLTLVLATEREYFDEAHSWCGTFTGLFLLDVASAEMSDSDDEYVLQPWECPALRTLRVMSAAEGGARVAEEDVRRVLERHLYAPALQRLEMLRVELYNPTTLLHGYVEEVVYLPDEEFDRVWPGLFPDLEWAGAVGMQECMTAAV